MFPSMEVRWFYKGVVPEEVVAWFQQDRPEVDEQPGRLDYYLCLGDMDGLGIKLREGRIEIKQRQHQRGVVRFRQRVAGLVEGWRKWSLAMADPESDLSDIVVPVSSWIPVRKERSLRQYGVARDGRSTAVSAGSLFGQGCNVELTSIEAGGERWWSLGFEAFGDESYLWEMLLTVVEHVFALKVPFFFDASHSYAYPRWLGMLAQRL
jgi:hypothetical protein